MSAYRDLIPIEKCARCGYCEMKGSLHVHHIDRNRSNNDISNLIVLCANCHVGLHHREWKLSDIGILEPEIKKVEQYVPVYKVPTTEYEKNRELYQSAMVEFERNMLDKLGISLRCDNRVEVKINTETEFEINTETEFERQMKQKEARISMFNLMYPDYHLRSGFNE